MGTSNLTIDRLQELLRAILVRAIFFVITWSAIGMLRTPSKTLAATRNTARITYNIEYSRPDGAPLLLDAAIPDGKGPFPTAIIVHGGYWVEGSKTTYVGPIEPLLTGAGYAWFSIDYRLPPKYQYPTPVEDVEAAVRWVRAHAEQYHVDPRRIVLMGESAGGYLVAMVGVENQPAPGLAAVVDFYGPSDLTIIAKYLSQPPKGVPEFFGVSDFSEPSMKILHDASPVNRVQKQMPPFLFIQGTADHTVPFESSPLMCDAMKKAGAQCEVLKVYGADHGMESWEGKPGEQEWKPAMVDWLNSTLRVK
jgi:acetyl esterase